MADLELESMSSTYNAEKEIPGVLRGGPHVCRKMDQNQKNISGRNM